MVGSLYKITNIINGKIYIGKTYKSIDKRFREHIKESSKDRWSNRPLYKAMRKYGIENFTIDSLGDYEQGELEAKEIEYIKLYHSFEEGYNATLGGDGKRYFSYTDEEVVRLYQELKTVKAVAEMCDCCADTIREVLRNNSIDITKHFTQNIYCPQLNIHYTSVQELVNYLRENKLVGTMNDENIRRSVNRVIQGTRKQYCGMTFIKE